MQNAECRVKNAECRVVGAFLQTVAVRECEGDVTLFVKSMNARDTSPMDEAFGHQFHL